MSDANTIARPYAQAAFEEARQLGDLKGWSALLHTLAETLSHTEVQTLVANPRVANNKIEELVLSLCGALSGTQLAKQQHNFIRVLVDARRLTVATEISAMYEVLRAEAEQSVDVIVTSAFELSKEQQQRITAALKKRMQREIKLSCMVDKSLLGGIVIRAGDKVIDGSAITRLGEMANALS